MTTDPERGRADAIRNRDAILDAAVLVLAEEPDASLAEVAARAGLGRATLYRHFPSRETLRVAIREEALARAGAALEALDLRDCSMREGVRRAAHALVPLGLRFRIILAEGADNEPAFQAARARVLSPVAELIARGASSGELDPEADPAWVALVLAGLLATAVRAAGAGVLTPEEAAEQVSRALLDGFGRH